MDIARRAGVIAARYHGSNLDVEFKDDDEGPVTAADRECSELITRELEAAFPDDIVISEERPDDLRRLDASRVWYVDPIDGTRDFIRGETGFCVMIGLTIDGEPNTGVVHQPLTDTTYVGDPQSGAARIQSDSRDQIACSKTSDLQAVRMVVSKSHRDPRIDQIKAALGTINEANIGSVGLKVGLVAGGEAELYVTPVGQCSSWDTVAPAAILNAAGGRITDCYGQPLRYDRESVKHESGLVASNDVIHDAVIEKIASIV